MPQQTEIKTEDGRQLTVIYPDGKLLEVAKYDEQRHHVVVHYHPPHSVDIAEGVNGEPNFFIVPGAVVAGLQE